MNLIKNRETKLVIVLALIAALILTASIPAFASESSLSEVQTLLKTNYVDPVSDDTLNSTSIKDMLEKLNDPWTTYFTSEEYHSFLDAVNMQICGIGIMLDTVPEGIKVVSVFPNSPAKDAGLQIGDIITSAAGQSLAGKPVETASQLIRGEEGTKVDLILQRGTDSFPLTVTRRKIEVPTVSGELIDKTIGYVDVLSFGLSTPDEFEKTVKSLQEKGAYRWIIDLRDDPGGYVDTALNLAGYFIGSKPAMEIIDRSAVPQTYNAEQPSFFINEPVIFLTNKNSASASEILTAAVKDYNKATVIGTRTFGKGKMQEIFNLSEGGALKMTVARFYSPNGNTIDKTGVSPDIDLGDLDAKKAAVLLLDAPPDFSESTGNVRIIGNGQDFHLSLNEVESQENWPYFYKMVTSLDSDKIEIGSKNGWQAEKKTDTQSIWHTFFPDYMDAGNLSNIPLDKMFYVKFSDPIDWSTVNKQTMQLRESTTGQIIDVKYDPVSLTEIRLIPKEGLKANDTYWLVIKPEIHDRTGKALKSGAVAIAQTITS